MLLWSWKLFRMFKTAVAGRQHPTQLAWAIGLGIWLGMIPHGNLIAVALGLLILSVRVNHAAATLTTVAVTLVASRADGLFHSVGDRMLATDSVRDTLSAAWQYPLVPWTDLNNTVMLGSFVVGAVVIGPAVALLLPLCRIWAMQSPPGPAPTLAAAQTPPIFDDVATTLASRNWVERSEPAHETVRPPHRSQPHSRPLTLVGAEPDAPAAEVAGFQTAAASRVTTAPDDPRSQPPRREGESRRSGTHAAGIRPDGPQPAEGHPNEQLQIDEALNYLLRQLRNSYDKDAA